MSLHYVIDGYNVLKQIPYLTNRRLKEGRQSLLNLIRKYRLCGKNEVTVVFDGRDDVVAPPHRSPYVIIFSREESADEQIRKIVQKSKNQKRVIVVTDDKELKFQVKNLGAKVISVNEFSKKIAKKEAFKDSQYKSHLEKEDAYKITEELKKVWLEENES